VVLLPVPPPVAATSAAPLIRRLLSYLCTTPPTCSEPSDEVLEDTCPQNIALKWHAEASSAVYSTPLITDLFSDGRKDIIVPSFLHNLEVGAGGRWAGAAWEAGADVGQESGCWVDAGMLGTLGFVWLHRLGPCCPAPPSCCHYLPAQAPILQPQPPRPPARPAPPCPALVETSWQVFEGRDGAKTPDFEAYHASTAHTSPLLFDADLDGIPDILLATYNGEILFFKDTVGGWAGGRAGWHRGRAGR